ncbi:hypothetical protein [Catelliglobosispora koreensis]|uniref:hypothetical protein n=1 Tax=Catelliglobosispora koreensis TaxID=129052 RepID=UPI0003A7CEE4|nr:hypothetical protein [Catelliglobosispora koreensis]
MASRLLSSLPVRPRTAIALMLLLLVGLVVIVGKIIGGDPDPGPNLGSAPSTVDPTAGNDSVVDPRPSASPRQPTKGAAVATVATTFAQNWIEKKRTPQAWRSALAPLATKALQDELTGVDPVNVPAERITGATTTQVYADAVVDATVPCDAGKLRLRLVFVEHGGDGSWLVDGIDWDRA